MRPLSHTQVSNDFIEQSMKTLNGSEVKVFLAICRKTIGWHKETDYISISQMQEMTGLSNRVVIKSAEELHNRGLIIKEKGRGINKYSLNYDEKSHHEEVQSDEKSQDKVTKSHKQSDEKSHTKETHLNKLNTKETHLRKSDLSDFVGMWEDGGYEKHEDYVYLHPYQLKKLNNEFGLNVVKDYILRLDQYMTDHPEKQPTGKKPYRDHCKVIRNWLRKAGVLSHAGFKVEAEDQDLLELC